MFLLLPMVSHNIFLNCKSGKKKKNAESSDLNFFKKCRKTSVSIRTKQPARRVSRFFLVRLRRWWRAAHPVCRAPQVPTARWPRVGGGSEFAGETQRRPSAGLRCQAS